MQKSSQITGNQNSSQSSLNQPKNNNDFTQVYIAYPLFYRIQLEKHGETLNYNKSSPKYDNLGTGTKDWYSA